MSLNTIFILGMLSFGAMVLIDRLSWQSERWRWALHGALRGPRGLALILVLAVSVLRLVGPAGPSPPLSIPSHPTTIVERAAPDAPFQSNTPRPDPGARRSPGSGALPFEILAVEVR